MKTTVELPEELLREAQAEASRRGLLLAELLAEALRRMPPSPDRSNAKPARLHLGAHAADLSALMADGEGIIDLDDHSQAVAALIAKYQDVPMSLADACLVRMAEVHDRHVVFTLDSDFSIYRKHGRSPIAVLVPA